MAVSQNKPVKKVETIHQADLLSVRGWTKKLIEDFYPIPFARKKRYGSSVLIKLFSLEEVVKIENDPLFKVRFDMVLKQRENRKNGSQKAIETKTKKIVELIESINISVISVKQKDLVADAVDSYNEFQLDRGNYNGTATLKCDKEFLDRIVVNYIRHNLTEYDEGLDLLYKRVGQQKAYQLLREKVFSAIAKAYPNYKNECSKQLLYGREEFEEND